MYWGDIDELEHWQPQEGEWCWFSLILGERCEATNVPMLCQFEQIVKEMYLTKQFDRMAFGRCEPFIGTLPTWIKDEKL